MPKRNCCGVRIRKAGLIAQTWDEVKSRWDKPITLSELKSLLPPGCKLPVHWLTLIEIEYADLLPRKKIDAASTGPRSLERGMIGQMPHLARAHACFNGAALA
jgi:hypothetical protein